MERGLVQGWPEEAIFEQEHPRIRHWEREEYKKEDSFAVDLW